MELDLLGVACPMNFVRTKLKLDDMQAGEELIVFLDDGEAIESVSKSVVQEGHQIKSQEKHQDGWKLTITRQ